MNFKDYEESVIKACRENSGNKVELFLSYKNNYMRVGRNFEPNVNPADLIDLTERTFLDFKKECDIVKAVESLSAKFKVLHSKSKHNTMVASSKFLWLFNHSIIIMDNLNQVYLNAKDYRDYVTIFENYYKDKKSEIDTLIKKHNLLDIDFTMGEDWFKMRVFDQYLWTLAASNAKMKHKNDSFSHYIPG